MKKQKEKKIQPLRHQETGFMLKISSVTSLYCTENRHLHVNLV